MPHASPLDGIDRTLVDLPSPWVIGWQDECRLALGSTGAFVLIPGEVDLAAAADRAMALAVRTRTILAHHTSWVPFIDAAVVTASDRRARRAVSAIVVPVDLLGELLTEGAPVIDQAALRVLGDLLVAGQLDRWKVGFAPADVNIDLCEPQPDAPSGAHL